MPNFTLSDRLAISDFVHGLTFMGTGGGGGNPAPVIDLLMKEVEKAGPIRIVDIRELAPEAWTVSVAGLGGRPPEHGPSDEELQVLGLTEPRYTGRSLLVAAVQELEKYARIHVEAIICGELGSGNSPMPILVGRQLAIPTVDGDYAGRAIPEIGQTVPDVLGRSACPFSFVDRWGNVVIVKEAASPAMIDRVGRMLCIAGYGGVSFAGFLARADEVRDMFVPNTLSRALAIGRAGRLACERGESSAEAMASAAGGWVLFNGVVDRTERDQREAYMFGYGTHYLGGTGGDTGHTFRIWYKNEHHVSWLDDRPFVTSPDCLAVIDCETGESLPNSDIHPGRRVAVIGWPAHPAHRSLRGIEVLGPRHFGFDIDFVPIEERVRGMTVHARS